MLLAQAGTPPRSQDECSICHDTTVDLVRDSLQLRDGVLYSRNTGQPFRHILDHHQELVRDDVEFFINVLTRVAYEVFRP